MKKVLVTALAVGVCVGVASTAWGAISADADSKRNEAGGIGGGGGGDKSYSYPIFYASEGYSATNDYVIPQTMLKVSAFEVEAGKEGTITVQFPDAIASQGVDSLPTSCIGYAALSYDLYDTVNNKVITNVTTHEDTTDHPYFQQLYLGYNVRSGSASQFEGNATTSDPTGYVDENQIEILGPISGSPLIEAVANTSGNGFVITVKNKYEKTYAANSAPAEFGDLTAKCQNDNLIPLAKCEVRNIKLIGHKLAGSLNETPAYPGSHVEGFEILVNNIKFKNPGTEMKGEYDVVANVTVADSGSGDSGSITVAASIPYFQGSSFKTGANGIAATVDAKAEMKEFYLNGTQSTKNIEQGEFSVTMGKLFWHDTIPVDHVYQQNGTSLFDSKGLNATVSFAPGIAGALSDQIEAIWMDLNGDEVMDKDEEFDLSSPEKAELSFNMAGFSSAPVYIDVKGEERLPFYESYKMDLYVETIDKQEVTTVDNQFAGIWNFNGTVLQIPRFEIKGAKCNATLTNTSGKEVAYTTDFYTTEKGASGDVTEGDLITGTIPASGTVNIPCNKIIKKVKGNQGTVQFVVAENPLFIGGTYQATKGSGISNDAMTVKDYFNVGN